MGQQESNRDSKVLLCTFIVCLSSLFLNVYVSQKLMNSSCKSNYVKLSKENIKLKSELEIHKKLSDVYTSVISNQKSNLEYYSFIFSKRSIENIELLKEQKKFFDEELKKEKDKLKRKEINECQKVVNMEQSKQVLGKGGS